MLCGRLPANEVDKKKGMKRFIIIFFPGVDCGTFLASTFHSFIVKAARAR